MSNNSFYSVNLQCTIEERYGNPWVLRGSRMRKVQCIWFILGLIMVTGWAAISPTFSDKVIEEEISVVRLAAVGDVIMHLPVVRSGYRSETDGYDFRPCFEEVREYLSDADIAVAVLESPLAEIKDRKFTGYPLFKAPPAIADALQWAGIDLVFTAHNHSLDQGAAGVRHTLTYLDRIGLAHTGSRLRSEDPDYAIFDINGIRLGFLSYTTSTNGIPLPANAPYLVNVLDFKTLPMTVAKLKELEADVIITALHDGVEYQRWPSREQRTVVQKLLEAGVDIVLGSHVHVIQPFEYQTVVNKDGSSRECFVAYSLGNFLSNQQWRYSDCGLMLTLEIEKSSKRPGVTVRLDNYQPVWVHRYPTQGRYIYRLKLVKGPVCDDPDPRLDSTARKRMEEVWKEMEDLLARWREDREKDAGY